MLKIRKDTSVRLSLIAAWAALAVLACLCVTLPFILRAFLSGIDTVYMKHFVPLLVCMYVAVVPVSAADIMLIWLLGLVRRAEIFTPQAVSLLRGISWCCFIECVVFGAAAFILHSKASGIFVVIVFVAAFLGLVLRVVKNVIEQASDIKAENDYTI